MLANNQRVNKSEGDKRELDFDFLLEQLLSMGKNPPSPYNSQSLKTSTLKPKDKSKSHSNKICSYYSKPSHSNHSCYYKYSEKKSDTFQEKQKNKITKLKCIAGNKNSKEKQGTFSLRNAPRFITTNVVGQIINLFKDKKWYFDNAASFYMTCDLSDFEDEKLIQSYKDEMIRSIFGHEKRPQTISRI